MFKSLLRKKASVFASPVKGILKELENVNDEVFSGKVMGDGFAIEPKSSDIYSPVTGSVEFVFETGHAIGLKTDAGEEILIHVGVDTVSLQGKGFTPHVTNNQKVKQGDLLLTVEFDTIRELVPSTDVIVIFTSGEKCNVLKANEEITNGEKDFIQYEKVKN